MQKDRGLNEISESQAKGLEKVGVISESEAKELEKAGVKCSEWGKPMVIDPSQLRQSNQERGHGGRGLGEGSREFHLREYSNRLQEGDEKQGERVKNKNSARGRIPIF